jgi:hypothetical protein
VRTRGQHAARGLNLKSDHIGQARSADHRPPGHDGAAPATGSAHRHRRSRLVPGGAGSMTRWPDHLRQRRSL